MKLHALNACLHTAHLSIIVFTCVGWAWGATRPAHLVLCALIALSWFVLGPIIGRPGYCAVTGLQHRLWSQLGRVDHPNYVTFLYRALTGRPGDPRTIDLVTQGVFYAAALASIVASGLS